MNVLASSTPDDGDGLIRTEDHAIAYLGFFCAFTAGKEAPRLIIDDSEDLTTPKSRSPTEGAASPHERRQGARWSPRAVVVRDAPELDLDFTGIGKKTLADDAAPEVTRIGASFLILCRLVDGTNLYRAAFRVDPCGRVRTVDCSEPILIYYNRRVLMAETPIFALEKPRRRISGKDMQTWILTGRDPAKNGEPGNGGDGSLDQSCNASPPSPPAVIKEYEPLLVTGSLNLRSEKIESLVDFANLYITGDLILEHASADRSLIFRSIEIRGRLRAQHLDCEGTVSLQDGKVLGWLTSPGGRPLREPAIDLHNSNIKEDLDLSGVTLNGGLDCQQTDIGGLVDLSGLQINTDDRVLRAEQTGLAMPSRRPAHGDVRQGPFNTTITASLAHTASLPFGAIGVSLAGSKVQRGVMLRTPSRRPSGPLGRSAVDRETQIIGWLSLKGAAIGGDVDGTTRLPDGSDGLKILPCRLCVALPESDADGRSDTGLRQAVRDFLHHDETGAGRQDTAALEILVDLGDGTPHLLVDVSSFVDFSTMTAEGDVDLQHLWASGVIDFSSANVRGEINLRHATIGYGSPAETETTKTTPEFRNIIMMPNLEVKGEADFGAAWINGTIFAMFCKISGIFDLSSHAERLTRIAGKLVLSGSTLYSDLLMEGTKIFGQIEIIAGSYGRVQATPCLVMNGEDEYEICNHQNHGFIAQDAELQSINLTGSRVCNKQLKEYEYYTDKFVSGAVVVENCKINGDLSFFRRFTFNKIDHEIAILHNVKNQKVVSRYISKDRARELKDDELIKDMRSRVESQVGISFSRIGGTIDLRDLRVGMNDGGGNILIRRCTVGANLNASAITNLLCPPNETSAARAGTTVDRRLKLKAKDVGLPFTCCEGIIDLSGLMVTGNVDASRSAAGGDLILWRGRTRTRSNGQTVAQTRFQANIKGKLSLLGARAPRLFLSGHSFKNQEEDLSLERAQIGHLTQIAPIPPRTNYSDLTVERWDLYPNDPNDPKDEKDLKDDNADCTLQKALENSAPFNRSIYAHVERMLRDRGDDAAANAIYRDMRERAIRRGQLASGSAVVDGLKQLLIAPVRIAAYLVLIVVFLLSGMPRRDERFKDPLRWLGTVAGQIIDIYLVGRMTGYGTRTFTLLLVFLPMLALSAVIFSKAENFAPTASHLGEYEVVYGRDDAPRPEVWGAAEAAAAIARYHIPIIPLFVESRWEPADDRPLCLAPAPPEPAAGDGAKPRPDAQPSRPCRIAVSWISPAGYALIVFLLHWIIWPLAIAGFSGLIRSSGRH